MHPKYRDAHSQITAELKKFDANVMALPGIHLPGALSALGWQIIDSRRKIDRTCSLQFRDLSAERAQPASDLFDPEMAAVLSARSGDIENALWLAFLSVHFGRHGADGWRLTSKIYGALGPSPVWTWQRISTALPEFHEWLGNTLRQQNEALGRFGNHRKYETLDPQSNAGTASVVESYVKWGTAVGGQSRRFKDAIRAAGGDPRLAFGLLYKSLSCVLRFGRLAKFDFLTLVGKLGLAKIEPDMTYMSEATGPLKGAKLLFDGNRFSATSAKDLELAVAQLDEHLRIGMQAMEDALCNWQKSPNAYIAFRG